MLTALQITIREERTMSIHSKCLIDGRGARALLHVLFCAGWALLAGARETLFRVDFGEEGKPCPFEKVGRFQCNRGTDFSTCYVFGRYASASRIELGRSLSNDSISGYPMYPQLSQASRFPIERQHRNSLLRA